MMIDDYGHDIPVGGTFLITIHLTKPNQSRVNRSCHGVLMEAYGTDSRTVS